MSNKFLMSHSRRRQKVKSERNQLVRDEISLPEDMANLNSYAGINTRTSEMVKSISHGHIQLRRWRRSSYHFRWGQRCIPFFLLQTTQGARLSPQPYIRGDIPFSAFVSSCSRIPLSSRMMNPSDAKPSCFTAPLTLILTQLSSKGCHLVFLWALLMSLFPRFPYFLILFVSSSFFPASNFVAEF